MALNSAASELYLARWAVFVSGNGSNLESLLSNPALKGRIPFVFTNRADAKAVMRIKRKGQVIIRLMKISKENSSEDWIRFAQELNVLRVKYIFLLGFMRIVPKVFLENFKGDVFNLHPSLLPDFKGADAFNKSFEARKSIGVSVHHVNEFLDEGQIAIQKSLNSCFKTDLMLYNNKVLAQKVHSYLEQRMVKYFLIRICKGLS
jgi:phosphoribosylglycinamide formyltransferase-1